MTPLALIALAFLAFFKALHFGFIWDDDYHVTANPCVVGPWGLREIWTTSNSNFFPLVLTTFRLEYLLWGAEPHLFHLVNLLFHASSAVMLWMVLRELRITGAWLGAALWCVHPVQMESALWISEQKNTESTVFYLLSILLFLRFCDRKKESWILYAGSLVCAVLALSSKTSTVVLPLALILCLWWRKEEMSFQRMIRLGPFFLLSAIAGVLTILEQRYHVGATGHEYTLDLPQRLALVGITPWFYLEKLAWPAFVNFIYPKWGIPELIPLGWILLSAQGIFIVSTWHLRGRVSFIRPLLFGWIYFLMALIPVAGLCDGYFFRYSYVSDHFQYLASMGPMALVGAFVYTLRPRTHSVVLGGIFLTLLLWVDWTKSDRFLDSRSLWRDTIKQNSACWMAYGNLGMIAHREGRIAEAESFFEKALGIHGASIEALNNLGVMLMEQGDLQGAKRKFEKVLELEPKESRSLWNLGEIALRKGEPSGAMRYYERAIQANDLNTEAKCSLAALLQSSGNGEQAKSLLRDACQKSPRAAMPHFMLANLLAADGSLEGGLLEYNLGLSLDPTSERARNEVALLQMRMGHIAEAIGELRHLLAENPNNTDARLNLALMLLDQGAVNDASDQFQALLKISPADYEALNAYATAQLRLKDDTGAIRSYRDSLRLKPDQPEVLSNLALILASGAGTREDASELANRALTLASKTNNGILAEKIRRDLETISKGEKVQLGF